LSALEDEMEDIVADDGNPDWEEEAPIAGWDEFFIHVDFDSEE
jgi:hypothetical protein